MLPYNQYREISSFRRLLILFCLRNVTWLTAQSKTDARRVIQSFPQHGSQTNKCEQNCYICTVPVKGRHFTKSTKGLLCFQNYAMSWGFRSQFRAWFSRVQGTHWAFRFKAPFCKRNELDFMSKNKMTEPQSADDPWHRSGLSLYIHIRSRCLKKPIYCSIKAIYLASS